MLTKLHFDLRQRGIAPFVRNYSCCRDAEMSRFSDPFEFFEKEDHRHDQRYTGTFERI